MEDKAKDYIVQFIKEEIANRHGIPYDEIDPEVAQAEFDELFDEIHPY